MVSSLFVGLTMNIQSICIMLVIWAMMKFTFDLSRPDSLATMANSDAQHGAKQFEIPAGACFNPF
jgi:hypothetical protein